MALANSAQQTTRLFDHLIGGQLPIPDCIQTKLSFYRGGARLKTGAEVRGTQKVTYW